jgi:hypothetical protein
MRYTYDLYEGHQRLSTTTLFDEIFSEDLDPEKDRFAVVTDNLAKEKLVYLRDHTDLIGWSEKLSRDFSWLRKDDEIKDKREKTPVSNAVNPSHYKNYIEDMQWIDAMSRIPTLRKPERFKAAVEMQIRKYLDRNGGKDAELQELEKSLFYMMYLVEYVKNGHRPVSAARVHERLRR